eukprot:684166-Prymnesium_polylepis.1
MIRQFFLELDEHYSLQPQWRRKSPGRCRWAWGYSNRQPARRTCCTPSANEHPPKADTDI